MKFGQPFNWSFRVFTSNNTVLKCVEMNHQHKYPNGYMFDWSLLAMYILVENGSALTIILYSALISLNNAHSSFNKCDRIFKNGLPHTSDIYKLPQFIPLYV